MTKNYRSSNILAKCEDIFSTNDRKKNFIYMVKIITFLCYHCLLFGYNNKDTGCWKSMKNGFFRCEHFRIKAFRQREEFFYNKTNFETNFLLNKMKQFWKKNEGSSKICIETNRVEKRRERWHAFFFWYRDLPDFLWSAYDLNIFQWPLAMHDPAYTEASFSLT